MNVGPTSRQLLQFVIRAVGGSGTVLPARSDVVERRVSYRACRLHGGPRGEARPGVFGVGVSRGDGPQCAERGEGHNTGYRLCRFTVPLF